ncbi:MAG: DUF523 domain-containing protein [bacterium]
MTSKVLVSACLLGQPVRYDARSNANTRLMEIQREGRVVPVCPEVAGGLAVPRPAAEIVGGDGNDVLDGNATVQTADGIDVTKAFIDGAHHALRLAQRHGVAAVVLKARSPSCGNHAIYDGSHSGVLTAGEGVTTALLRRHGILVLNEDELDQLP